MNAHSKRLVQIDGLRGIAVLAVMLFHFTTRYQETLGHTTPPAWALPQGYLGVELFFVISGFVILMTVEAARSPQDFVVSRFSRLYPSYWVGVAISSALAAWSILPGQALAPAEITLNLTMVQGMLGVADVDGVYWTLAVELTFYLWMLLLLSLGALTRLPWLLGAWMLLSLATALAGLGHMATPYAIERVLLLRWIPWFGLGMLAYRSWHGEERPTPLAWATGSLALVSILVRDGVGIAMLAAVCALAVGLAARGRLRPAQFMPLTFIGAISYPLYLTHERVGSLAILWTERQGFSPQTAIGVAFFATLTAAYVLHHTVELPSMRWLRQRYRNRQAPQRDPAAHGARPAWVLACLVAIVLFTAGEHIANRLRGQPKVARGESVGILDSPAARQSVGDFVPVTPASPGRIIAALSSSSIER